MKSVGCKKTVIHILQLSIYNGGMSSLFDKFRTLVKASIPGRRSPYAPSEDTRASGADIEERLEWMEEQDRKKREAAKATESMQERLQSDPDPEAELAEIVEELEAEQVAPALDSAESVPPASDSLSDELMQELQAESAEIHQQVDASNDEAQAIAGRAAELTEQAGNARATAPTVDKATVAEARRTLDSAEKDIAAVPTGASDAIKKSAQQAQALIDKARAAIDGDTTDSADESILKKASRTLDSAAKGIGVPADATDAVKKSAQQASELIDKARGLINEKSAELTDATDLPLPTIPSDSDDNEASSELDDIKRRLG